MKVSKLLLPLIFCFSLITVVPEAVFAASYTTKNYSFVVIENSYGVPFIITGTEWLSINGYTNSQNLVVNYFDISGVLRNYKGYPFDMTQVFTSGELYETSLDGSGIKKGIVNASQVQRYDFLYDPSDQTWSAYGKTSDISISLNKTVACWATIYSWWHSSGTFPAYKYPALNHAFWNGSAGWTNNQ